MIVLAERGGIPQPAGARGASQTDADQEYELKEEAPDSDEPEPVCSFCDSRRLGLVMDFGEVGLAGAFLKPEQATERTFPMRLRFCKDCYAVQVTDRVPADVLFQNYFYFSSAIGTLREHFSEYAAEVTQRFLDPAKATVLEFGCNDGVLLRPLADQGIRTSLVSTRHPTLSPRSTTPASRWSMIISPKTLRGASLPNTATSI
jgi:hypothetical protein